MSALRIGTRASRLARAQSVLVASALEQTLGWETRLVDVATHGDASREALTAIGGSGVFASALREALLRGEVDVAVHSLKDLPTQPADGVTLAAVPPREDPRDVLVARDGLTLAGLPAGARVGTGSPRRAVQLGEAAPDLVATPIRGNVETRIGKARDGEVDAVILAAAGIHRLDLAGAVTEVLDPDQMMPAPGQGALAVECRDDDPDLCLRLGAALEDSAARSAVTAERGVLAELEAGCSAPVGALAQPDPGEAGTSRTGGVAPAGSGGRLWVRAVASLPDATPSGGAQVLRRSTTVDPDDPGDAAEAGARLARELLAAGASTLI